MLSKIEIVGARTHNLKNVNCSFAHEALTVITGISGSGKSSLAFDTLYAEGQRRYVESMSTYARQFLERMERPDVDFISGIQPAIALEQRNTVKNARSTVGTATEIHDYLRLLFARLGVTTCPECGRPVRSGTPESAMKVLAALPPRSRLMILAPAGFNGAALTDALKGELIRSGYFRLWNGSDLIDLESGEAPAADHRPLSILIDRVAAGGGETGDRVLAALQTAFIAGRGSAVVRNVASGEEIRFSAGLTCDGCGRSFPQPQPAMFSFHSPLGACGACQGFGRLMEIDLEKVIPNPELSIDEGAIACWNGAGNLEMYDHLRERTTPRQVPRHLPVSKFSPEQRGWLINGVGKYIGIRGFFDYLEGKKYKVQARVMLARYRAYTTCPHCGGTRLKPEGLNVRFEGRTIADLARLPVKLLLGFLQSLEMKGGGREVAERIFGTLLARLRYLDQVGLGYLTLDRATRTLSGGEAQRINLAASLGSGLTQTLYVLDEPTVGLHSRDTDRLIDVLKSLRDLGNTVVVVEHDLDVIRAADAVLDVGPGAGERGGEVLFSGTLVELATRDTATARHMAGYGRPAVPSRGRKARGWITVKGARGNNLKGIDARFPLGVLCCVTGVSGSGKTTLVRDTLSAAFKRTRESAPVEVRPCSSIEGLEQVKELLWVDQAPPARSTRSNPATFVKAFDAIRDVLGKSREARAAGLEPRHFSFNMDAGRCPTCEGAGVQTIDMHFMADVEVRCETCDGRRFKPKVLALRWNGLNIDEILQLTVEEACAFFSGAPKVARALEPLREVGLGYLRLGQNTPTLSGGEAQRLKLAGHLARMREGSGMLYIFDEPTTGLHATDLTRLAEVFHRLVDRGATVLVVEHNLDLIATADHLIDLGPEGGDEGGRIVAEGTPEEVADNPQSLTGMYLKSRFGKNLAPVRVQR